jgi:ParB family chromosome partitioning protein
MALNLNIDADALDLMSLGNKAPAKVEDSGKPIEFDIDDLIEDPNQPRQDFDEEEMEQLAKNIKRRGVRTPISVKPKNADGKHVINHGARRYRGSKMAGRKTVPGFIDETHDKYDQVAENLLRSDLTPMSLALFCHERLKAGDSRKLIADNLGQKSQSFISEVLPLVDAPAFIQTMARKKKHSGKTLYVLFKAWEKKPEEIEAYVASTEEITRPGIQAVLQGSNAPETVLTAPGDVPEGGPAADPVAAVQQPAGGDLDAKADQAPAPAPQTTPAGDVPPPQSSPQAAAGHPVVVDAEAAPAVVVPPKPVKAPGASLPPRQVSITVKVDGRIAMLKQAGKITVTFEETGESKEIDFATVEIVGTKSV